MAAGELTAMPRSIGEVLIEADAVTFGYGRTLVLDRVSLSVRAGEFVALVGPNGSGKSTLLRVLLGSLTPSSGTVRLFGGPPERVQRARIGYVPQRPSLEWAVPATVEEIVTSGRLPRRGWWRPLRREDREFVGHALGAVGLAELARTPLNELSGGQQQRAFIARAFATEPASACRRDAELCEARTDEGKMIFIATEAPSPPSKANTSGFAVLCELRVLCGKEIFNSFWG